MATLAGILKIYVDFFSLEPKGQLPQNLSGNRTILALLFHSAYLIC